MIEHASQVGAADPEAAKMFRKCMRAMGGWLPTGAPSPQSASIQGSRRRRQPIWRGSARKPLRSLLR